MVIDSRRLRRRFWQAPEALRRSSALAVEPSSTPLDGDGRRRQVRRQKLACSTTMPAPGLSPLLSSVAVRLHAMGRDLASSFGCGCSICSWYVRQDSCSFGAIGVHRRTT